MTDRDPPAPQLPHPALGSFYDIWHAAQERAQAAGNGSVPSRTELSMADFGALASHITMLRVNRAGTPSFAFTGPTVFDRLGGRQPVSICRRSTPLTSVGLSSPKR